MVKKPSRNRTRGPKKVDAPVAAEAVPEEDKGGDGQNEQYQHDAEHHAGPGAGPAVGRHVMDFPNLWDLVDYLGHG